MRPVGLEGTKTLQDLFTDRKVPRALRRTLPVVEAGGRIVWVAGVALDERFAARGEGTERVGLIAVGGRVRVRDRVKRSRRGPELRTDVDLQAL